MEGSERFIVWSIGVGGDGVVSGVTTCYRSTALSRPPLLRIFLALYVLSPGRVLFCAFVVEGNFNIKNVFHFYF